MRTCSLTDCDKAAWSRGLCQMHYRRARLDGTIADAPRARAASGQSPLERLEARGWDVSSAGCWIFRTSSRRPHPVVRISGTWRRASHLAFEAWVGEVPLGACVLHSCDNPPCVNPAHLLLGDRTLNSRDKVTKGRAPNGERMAHKLSDLDVEEIRARRATGETCASLAREYGVSSGHISVVARGLSRRRPTRPLPEGYVRF